MSNPTKKNPQGLNVYPITITAMGQTFDLEVPAINERVARRKAAKEEKRLQKKLQADETAAKAHQELVEAAKADFEADNRRAKYKALIESSMPAIVSGGEMNAIAVYYPHLQKYILHPCESEEVAKHLAVNLATAYKQVVVWVKCEEVMESAVEVSKEMDVKTLKDLVEEAKNTPAKMKIVTYDILPIQGIGSGSLNPWRQKWEHDYLNGK